MDLGSSLDLSSGSRRGRLETLTHYTLQGPEVKEVINSYILCLHILQTIPGTYVIL